jgi:thioredoxin-related protein
MSGFKLSRQMHWLLLAMILALYPIWFGKAATTYDNLNFNDFPLEEPLHYPDWFKQSFLDLRDDLKEALEADKKGIIVYFGQRRCAYCRMLMEVNFGLSDIVTYTQRHFDVIPIDIWGVAELTDVQGETLSERDFALREHTNFTPSLIFYDADGEEALRLRGYYPPYQFRAALEFVAGGHYKQESFNEYLARGEDAIKFEPGELIEEAFFSPPPHNLDRSRMASARPLVVFFEQGDCHACDVLHGNPLHDQGIAQLFRSFDNVQLDMWADTPLITPAGERTSAKRWARDLGLFYAPSLLFFDEHGREILRVDSVVGFYRLRSVLRYIQSHGYLSEPNYQRWRLRHQP